MNHGNARDNAMRNANLKAANGALIIRPEEAEQRRLVAEVQKAQATLNELGQMQDSERSLFGTMLGATLSRRDMSDAEVTEMRHRAKALNDSFQTEKWQQVAETLADIGVTGVGEQQSHMVWAAKRFGVVLVPPKAVLTTADAPKAE